MGKSEEGVNTNRAFVMEFYDNEKGLNALCAHLRGKDGPSVREAVLSDKRVLYLKGRRGSDVGRWRWGRWGG